MCLRSLRKADWGGVREKIKGLSDMIFELSVNFVTVTGMRKILEKCNFWIYDMSKRG